MSYVFNKHIQTKDQIDNNNVVFNKTNTLNVLNILRDERTMFKEQLQEQQDTFIEYIDVLNQHRKNYEKVGNFAEAEKIKIKLAKLKDEQNNKVQEKIQKRHIEEKIQIEEAYLREFAEFNDFWDEKQNELKREILALEQQLAIDQKKELEEQMETFEWSLPVKPKLSSTIINNKIIKDKLMLTQDYVNAEKLNQKILDQQSSEYNEYQFKRQDKIEKNNLAIKKKLDQEMEAFKHRIKISEKELKKARQLDKDTLLQKFTNFKKELESYQKNELARMLNAKNKKIVYTVNNNMVSPSKSPARKLYGDQATTTPRSKSSNSKTTSQMKSKIQSPKKFELDSPKKFVENQPVFPKFSANKQEEDRYERENLHKSPSRFARPEIQLSPLKNQDINTQDIEENKSPMRYDRNLNTGYIMAEQRRQKSSNSGAKMTRFSNYL